VFDSFSVHWIVNYELEKQFEEAKLSLRGVDAGDDEPMQELLLFHGTLPKNIDSYVCYYGLSCNTHKPFLLEFSQQAFVLAV
jgi:hypothetical protein